MLDRRERQTERQINHSLYSEVRTWYILVEVALELAPVQPGDFPMERILGRSSQQARRTCFMARRAGKWGVWTL